MVLRFFDVSWTSLWLVSIQLTCQNQIKVFTIFCVSQLDMFSEEFFIILKLDYEFEISIQQLMHIWLCARDFYLNNRLVLSRNNRLIVARRNLFDFLETNISLRRDASRANTLILNSRTSNFQGAIIRAIVLSYKHSIVFIVHTKFYSAHHFKNHMELFSTVLDETRESLM